VAVLALTIHLAGLMPRGAKKANAVFPNSNSCRIALGKLGDSIPEPEAVGGGVRPTFRIEDCQQELFGFWPCCILEEVERKTDASLRVERAGPGNEGPCRLWADATARCCWQETPPANRQHWDRSAARHLVCCSSRWPGSFAHAMGLASENELVLDSGVIFILGELVKGPELLGRKEFLRRHLDQRLFTFEKTIEPAENRHLQVLGVGVGTSVMSKPRLVFAW